MAPGKFEGEPAWVETLWNEVAIIGGADDVQVGVVLYSYIPFCEEITEMVPETKGLGFGCRLSEDDNGFVHCRVFQTKEEFTEDLNAAIEDGSEEYDGLN